MSLEQIGQKLRSAREAHNLSLRQIYDRTKIPLAHIQSIENGKTDELPEPVYVAGFIRLIADCVGLDGHGLSEEYRRTAEEKEGNGHNGWKQAGGQPVYVAPEYYSRGRADRGPPTFKTIYFNAIWVVVVVGLVSYLTMTQLNNQSGQQDPSVLGLQEYTQRFNAPVPSAATGTSGATSQAGGDARIALSASQHVWVEVKSASSGESLFTGYMEQGDRRDFQDPEGLRVRAGNGGSLTVDFRGKIESFGEAGKVAERSFMSQQATAAGSSGGDERGAQTAAARPATAAAATPRPAPKKDDSGAASRRSSYRSVDDVHTRQYIPGERLGGGTRSIDVPYRYTEGRLDLE